MDKAILLHAIEYLKAYQAELDGARNYCESDIEAFARDPEYCYKLESVIYWLTQIYFNYKENLL